MDVIEAASVARIKAYLDKNPLFELTARKTGEVKTLPWSVNINRIDAGTLAKINKYRVHSASMGDALQQVSRWIFEQNPTVQDIK